VYGLTIDLGDCACPKNRAETSNPPIFFLEKSSFWMYSPVSTAYCAYNNEVINYHSAEENTKTED
jgi:hypothetical protein